MYLYHYQLNLRIYLKWEQEWSGPVIVASLWPSDTSMTLQQLRCTVLWPCCNTMVTSWWWKNPSWNFYVNQSQFMLCFNAPPTTTTTTATTAIANQDVRSLFPLEAESSKSIVISSCEQEVLWSWARILLAFPPCLPWEQSPSTCDLLHIRTELTASSALWSHSNQSCDHTLASGMERESSRCALNTHSQDNVCVCSLFYMCVSARLTRKTITFCRHVDLLHCHQLVAMTMMQICFSNQCNACFFWSAGTWEETSTDT